MTSIPLFETLQNEMHRKMGCSHLGCFNENGSSSFNASRPPSKWPGGFYGFLCEGTQDVDPSVISLIYDLKGKSRQSGEKPASTKGTGYVDTEDIKSAASFGSSVDDIKQIAMDVTRYLDMPLAEQEVLEDTLRHTWHFDRPNMRRLLTIMSHMKRGDYDNRVTQTLLSGFADALTGRTDDFENGIPTELFEHPESYIFETPSERVSGSFAPIEKLDTARKESY